MLGQGMVNLPTLPTILTLVTLPSEAGERTDKQSCPILNIIRMFDDYIILTPPCTSHSGTPWPASPAFPPWPCWLSTHCRPTLSRCSLTQKLTGVPDQSSTNTNIYFIVVQVAMQVRGGRGGVLINNLRPKDWVEGQGKGWGGGWEGITEGY